MRGRNALPLKYRRIIGGVAVVFGALGVVAASLGGDYVGALWSASLALFAWLTLKAYERSPRRQDRLVYDAVGAVMVGIALYRLLFTLATPT